MKEKQFIIGSNYRLAVLPVGIVSAPSTATFSGLVNYAVASKFAPVSTWHAAALHLLPQDTPTDATKLTYCLFNAAGVTTVLANAWINYEATELIEQTKAQVTILNIDESRFNQLKATLQKAGYQVGEIKTV